MNIRNIFARYEGNIFFLRFYLYIAKIQDGVFQLLIQFIYGIVCI